MKAQVTITFRDILKYDINCRPVYSGVNITRKVHEHTTPDEDDSDYMEGFIKYCKAKIKVISYDKGKTWDIY